MMCPACLQYAQQVEAVAQVDGTQLCAAHAVMALQQQQALLSRGPRGRGPMDMLPQVPPPAEPVSAPGT